MLSFPNCKINIGLRILRRRPDGFHDIETVFLPLELCDVLEFVILPDDHPHGVRLSVTGTDIDCTPDNNLCVRAYKLLQADFNLPQADIYLHKVIPSGAGLGGGSSDAAFMLKTVSQKYNLGLNEDTLCEYASKLGSDCAFFIKNRPLLAYGRGNIFREIANFQGEFEVLVVHPGIHVSTAEAYAGVQPAIPEEGLENLISLPIKEWRHRIRNDFEESVLKKYPLIGEIKDKMYSMGAIYASMSGSGSAVYGLFKDVPQHINGQFSGMFVWRGRVKNY